MTQTVSHHLLDLLDRPLYASLGTIRPDNTVQVNPMWFEFVGDTLRFTHTSRRAKYRNLKHNPAMSLLVTDPDDPQRYVEVRGRLTEVVPDPEGAYYVHLAKRYGEANPSPPPDHAVRVILIMNIENVSEH